MSLSIKIISPTVGYLLSWRRRRQTNLSPGSHSVGTITDNWTFVFGFIISFLASFLSDFHRILGNWLWRVLILISEDLILIGHELFYRIGLWCIFVIAQENLCVLLGLVDALLSECRCSSLGMLRLATTS